FACACAREREATRLRAPGNLERQETSATNVAWGGEAAAGCSLGATQASSEVRRLDPGGRREVPDGASLGGHRGPDARCARSRGHGWGHEAVHAAALGRPVQA